MLIEDLCQGVIPVGGRTGNDKFSVNLNPDSQEIAALVARALPSRFGERRWLDAAVCDFVESVVRQIAYNGEDNYEIVYQTNTGGSKMIGFFLQSIPRFGLWKSPLGSVQIVPANVAKDLGCKRVIWLPQQSVTTFRFPRELGGSRRQKALLRTLDRFKGSIPEFSVEQVASSNREHGFDFGVFRDRHEQTLAKITRHLGWDGRNMWLNRCLDFYTVYRHLRFERTLAVLRSHVLTVLNDCLNTVGKKLGFAAKIQIQGLPTPEEIDHNVAELMSGNLSFKKAVRNYIW